MAMTRTGADLFVEAAEQYGVTRLFGNPGTTELPIMEAIGDSSLEYVLGLHEDVAVGMAAGYAKTRAYHAREDPAVTPVGLVNLHVAPGLAHGLGNVFDSSLVGTGAPLVVTAGNHPTDHQHHEPNLGGDLVEMADQFTKWSAEVPTAAALPTMLRRAFRVAMTPPTGPVFLSLPIDVMLAETDARPERLGTVPDGGLGDPEQVAAAADHVASAEEVVLVVGDGVARSGGDAVDSAVRFAEATGARVHGELKASEVSFPTAHEQWAGGLPRSQQATADLLDVDTVVFAGVVSMTPTNPPEVDLLSESTTTVFVSDHAWELGKNEVSDVGILGDPGRCLDQVAEATDLDAATVAARLDRVAAVREAQSGGPAETRTDDPRASATELATAMHAAAPDARVVVEAPTTTGVLYDAWEFEWGDFFKNRGGGLGWSLPAAIGSAVAEAETDDPRDVLAFVGDGSYLYYSNAIYSAARYGVDLTAVVADNRNYRILKDNALRIMGGTEEEYDFVGMDFDPPVDIPTTARGHGASASLVEDPDAIEGAVREAVAESGPTVLDVLIHD
ncbi:MAG: thiamine pyrophosphate-binding protein [Haloarculaceae archaeon]